MDQPNVISINPGAKTPGAIREEGLRYDRFPVRIASTLASAPRLKDTLNFITGIDTKAVAGVSPKLAVVRIAAGSALIAAAHMLEPFAQLPMMIGAWILGISLICGIFTRVLCTASIPLLAFAACKGMIDIPTASTIAFAALFFAIFGPGIYSADQTMRRAIFKRRQKNRRPAFDTGEFDYKAYIRARRS